MPKVILLPVLLSKTVLPALPSAMCIKIATRCVIHRSQGRFYALLAILFDKLSRNINDFSTFTAPPWTMDAKVGGSTFMYILFSQVAVRAMIRGTSICDPDIFFKKNVIGIGTPPSHFASQLLLN
jgi:hypothetical protein